MDSNAAGRREVGDSDEGRGRKTSYQHLKCRLGEKTTLQPCQSSRLHARRKKSRAAGEKMRKSWQVSVIKNTFKTLFNELFVSEVLVSNTSNKIREYKDCVYVYSLMLTYKVTAGQTPLQ